MFEQIDKEIAEIRQRYADDALRKQWRADQGPQKVEKLISQLQARIQRLYQYQT